MAIVRKPVRTGLTLIELVAALVLLSVLMAALTGIMPRFASRAADRQAAQAIADLAWSRAALERLADDLANADSGELHGSHLTLAGLLDRDPASGVLLDRPGSCTYRLVPWEEQTLLVREQHNRRSLLGCGRITVAIQGLLNDGQAGAAQQLGGQAVPAGKPVPLELAPRMRLTLLDEETEELARLLVVRQPFADGESLLPGAP